MHVLQGLGPQEESNELVSNPLHTYTHPYFGQLFLAGILGTFGYPNSLNPSSDVSSIKSIFLVPRILMGLLAIADTFLLYKITERRYNKTVAVIASVLFAVMPLTWVLRRIWLEPIQLPFLLLAILFALYSNNFVRDKRITSVLLSGALLGVAIFTKIPVIAFIPLVAYIIYANTKSPKLLVSWLLPVLLVPLIWPAYAASIGQFDKWVDGILWQSERQNTGLYGAILKLFSIDPLLIILSFSGIVYVFIRRRDLFQVLWFVPFLIFNFLSGYVAYWHLIPLLPAFCISSAILLSDISRFFRRNKIKTMIPFLIVCSIACFGLGVTTLLVTLNMTSFHYDVLSQIVQQVQEQNLTGNVNGADNSNDTIAVLGNNYFLWVPKYIYDKNGNNYYANYYNQGDVKSQRVLLIAGENFVEEMTRDNETEENVRSLREILVDTNLLSTTEENLTSSKDIYPFNSLVNLDPKASTRIEIRENYITYK